MAKYNRAEQKQKMLYAKDLFIKGFDYSTIADILELSESTLRKWGNENNFEGAKHASFIALSEIRNIVLESFAEAAAGRKPKIKPDEAAKYAAAFEKLSDKRKTLTYMYEAFELLTNEFIKDIQNAKTVELKDKALMNLRMVRDKMDKVLTSITNQVLNNDPAGI